MNDGDNCIEFIEALKEVTDSDVAKPLDDKFFYANWVSGIHRYIAGSSFQFNELLNNAAWLFSEAGENKIAIQLQTTCLDNLDKSDNCQELKVQAYNVMSLLLLKENNRLYEALMYQKKSLVLRKKINKSPYTSYHNIALIYSRMNYHNAAIKLETKVYEYEKATLAQDSAEFAITLSCLSTMYKKIGDFRNAIEFQKRALDIRRGKKDQLRFAKSCYAVAILYDLESNTEEAIQYYNETIQLLKKLNISNFLQLAICYTNLFFLCRENQYREYAITNLLNSNYVSIENESVNWEDKLQEIREKSLCGKIIF